MEELSSLIRGAYAAGVFIPAARRNALRRAAEEGTRAACAPQS